MLQFFENHPSNNSRSNNIECLSTVVGYSCTIDLTILNKHTALDKRIDSIYIPLYSQI